MTGEIKTTTKVEVTVKTCDRATGTMLGAVSAEASIENGCKAEDPGDVCEERIYINIKPGSQPNYQDAVISVNTDAKLTKADAG